MVQCLVTLIPPIGLATIFVSVCFFAPLHFFGLTPMLVCRDVDQNGGGHAHYTMPYIGRHTLPNIGVGD